MQNIFFRSAPKILYTILVGILCTFFALLLKKVGEGTERYLFQRIQEHFIWLLLATPLTGFLLIYFITTKVFKTRISGIREILDSLREPIQVLKPIKAILHFFTGIFTLVFGGSTGIEVSTVVASASIGSWVGQKKKYGDDFKRNLIVAGAVAGIAGLFKSPLAGLFFGVEVLMVTFSWELIILSTIAAFVAFGVRYFLDSEILFHPILHGWRSQAIPFYVMFSVVASFFSVYLTKGVILTKTIFNTRLGEFKKVWIGGLLLGSIVLLLVPLYGEGYGFIEKLLTSRTLFNNFSGISGIFLLSILLFLKPLATSITLGSGGDGGVFAPSLFLGAVAGCLFAQSANYFGANVVEVNFIIVGMAAILSASLHAPLTGAFLVMSITGSYELFIPIMLTSVLSSFLAKKIFPFTVYSYAS